VCFGGLDRADFRAGFFNTDLLVAAVFDERADFFGMGNLKIGYCGNIAQRGRTGKDSPASARTLAELRSGVGTNVEEFRKGHRERGKRGGRLRSSSPGWLGDFPILLV
jgi:hypothetical protein